MRLKALLLLASLWPVAAAADPLDPATCTGLTQEREQLIAKGAKDDMDRGPVWAKENNLGQDRLANVQRLMTVEEQLSFRCDKLVTARPAMLQPPEPAVKPEAPAVSGEKATTPSTTPEKPAKPVAAQPPGAAPAEPQKKKKKTTPSDAYIPPPPSLAGPSTDANGGTGETVLEVPFPSFSLTP